MIRSTSLVDENAENTERCLQTQQEEPPLTAVQDQEVDAPDIDESSIKIKLKFINDDLKMVDGRLDEELGSFRRHVSVVCFIIQCTFKDNVLIRINFSILVLKNILIQIKNYILCKLLNYFLGGTLVKKSVPIKWFALFLMARCCSRTM